MTPPYKRKEKKRKNPKTTFTLHFPRVPPQRNKDPKKERGPKFKI
jgi:hypothetical protein